MQANQTIGIDLPIKALVWQAASGQTWLSYNEPDWLAKQHGVTGAERVVTDLGLALRDVAAKAALAHPSMLRADTSTALPEPHGNHTVASP